MVTLTTLQRTSLTQTRKRSSMSERCYNVQRSANSYVDRFRQKFQHIVEQEQEDNFITKLHKGKFNIIPWPVIESAGFYDLFGALKIRLDQQPLTYKYASVFIGALKMLMAQLKVCKQTLPDVATDRVYRQTIGVPWIVRDAVRNSSPLNLFFFFSKSRGTESRAAFLFPCFCSSIGDSRSFHL